MEAMKESRLDIKDTFVNHVFKFDIDSNNEIINIFQYTLVSFILVVILNKFFHLVNLLSILNGLLKMDFSL